MNDVVCCLSPAGACAIAVIGLRGPTVWSKMLPYFHPAKKKPRLQQVPQYYLGKLECDGLGDEIVLVLSGNEDWQEIELQLHGGPGVVEWCLQFAQNRGCVKIDWSQWIDGELWKMLAQAPTCKTASILLDQCQGAMERSLASLRQRIVGEGQSPKDEIEQLLALESLGAHLVQPWKVVLAGPPNVGKSSLLNAIVGYERAITSSLPGTTRDLVSAQIAWNGYPLEFIDTAGVRVSNDSLEVAGIDKTIDISRNADVLLWLVDLSQKEATLAENLKPSFVVGTKADLPRLQPTHTDLNVSTITGQGIEELLSAITTSLVPIEPKPGQGIPVLPAQKEELHRLYSLLQARSG